MLLLIVTQTICLTKTNFLNLMILLNLNSYLKLLFLFKNGDLPKELNINTYNTRNASKGGLSIPKINATSFDIRSLRYSASVTWDECIKSINDFKDIKSIYFIYCYYYIYLFFLASSSFVFVLLSSLSGINLKVR